MKQNSAFRALGRQIQLRTIDNREMKVYCVPNFALMLQNENTPSKCTQTASREEFLSRFNKTHTGELLNQLSSNIELEK
jgi:hypothetical protein